MIPLFCGLCRGTRGAVKLERSSRVSFIRRLSVGETCPELKEERSDVPCYPPILDLSRNARKTREAVAWHDKVKGLGTIEEKLIELNMPQYFGWKCLMVNEGKLPYNSVELMQHYTRTHLVPGLPSCYNSKEMKEAADQYLNEVLLDNLQEALLFELRRELPTTEDMEPQQLEDARSRAVVQQLHSVITASLSRHLPHLLSAQVDFDPRIEAFWMVGGVDPPTQLRKSRAGLEWLKLEADSPIDRHIQYLGQPLLNLRCELPLRPHVEAAECEGDKLDVPHFNYDPRVLGMKIERRFGTNIPGFWPGDNNQFGLLSYHSRGHMLSRPKIYGSSEHLEALHSQAMMASYGWLLGQACYLGFSTFNDLTYPLTSQTVVTNGQDWSFYAYQMNTTLIHSDNPSTNPRRNVCWTTEPVKLFESVEGGKLLGLNKEVLKVLLKMYLNAPVGRTGVELRPYLDPVEPTIGKISQVDRRKWLESCFKDLYSNRPRGQPLPETYNWEWIYKILHKTRPFDARRRHFELWTNPMKRRLDDHRARYVPKILRVNKKWKREKTFYP